MGLFTCLVLNFFLADRLVVGSRWILPVLVGLPLIPLLAVRHHQPDQSPWVRHVALSLIGLVTLANLTSLVLLVDRLLATSVTQGKGLIASAVSIWLTNVIVYGVWFWEIDRGGPAYRAAGIINRIDLQFPQLENPSLAPHDWHPQFLDYLYTSFANGTSFAPADAMPLTSRMKVLFASESVVSLVAISIVAARAVNILR